MSVKEKQQDGLTKGIGRKLVKDINLHQTYR